MLGQSMVFEAKMSGTIEVSPSPLLGAAGGTAQAPSRHETEWQPKLRWQVVEVNSEGARIAGEVDEPHDGRHPFGLTVAPNCHFVNVGLSANVPASIGSQLRALLTLAEIRLAAGRWLSRLDAHETVVVAFEGRTVPGAWGLDRG